MKIYHTDLNKQSRKTKKGKTWFICGIIFLVLFMVSAIIMENNFEKGTDEIQIAFMISMVIMVIALICLIIGVITLRKKIVGEEDLRMFIHHNNDLYIIDNDGISNDHFAAFRLSVGSDNDPMSLLTATLGMISHKEELNEKINESRDLETIFMQLKNHEHNVIKDVEIIKDSGHTIEVVIRTVDGARRRIEIGDNYINYGELVSLIRSYGGK